MNKYIAKGNVTFSPELRRIPSGEAVVDFTLAINKKWKTQDGTQKENVVFPRFSVWGTSGEAFAQYVKKGDAILVEAEYTQNSKEVDGEKTTFHGFRVGSWEFAGGRKNSNDNKVEEKDEEVFGDKSEGVKETPKRGRPAKAKVTQPVDTEEDLGDPDSIPF